MPDMPQGAPAASPGPGGGDAQGQQSPQGGGGGIGQAIVQVDQVLNKITQAVTSNPQVGDDVKKAFQGALDSFRQASQALVKGVGGEGGEPDEDDGGGASTPEQGASKGAVPMSPATRG